MRAKHCAWTILVASLWLSSTAQANMTIAATAAGGLVPVKSTDIAIEREDLYVSPDLIKVHYRFRNSKNEDITAPILFPLPEIDATIQNDDSYVTPIEKDEGPAVIAKVSVDGHPVEVSARQRAYTRDGEDVTEQLRHGGLDFLSAYNLKERLDKLPEEEREALIKRGVVTRDGDSKWFTPNWIVRGEYVWSQSFMANGITEVDVSYRPLTGGGWLNLDGKVKASDPIAEIEKAFHFHGTHFDPISWPEHYCVDRKMIRALAKRYKPSNESPPAELLWTRYILLTARNWQGTIGMFHLTVEVPDDHSLAAFCAPDAKSPIHRTGLRTWEMTAKDFRPLDNFQIAVIKDLDH